MDAERNGFKIRRVTYRADGIYGVEKQGNGGVYFYIKRYSVDRIHRTDLRNTKY